MCKSNYGKTHYRENHDQYVWKGNEAKQRLVERNRHVLLDYLKKHPCVTCGEADPIVLDFDHRDPSQKLMNVSELMARVGKERLLLEVSKCDVLCANCHRRKSAAQLGHGRYRLLSVLAPII